MSAVQVHPDATGEEPVATDAAPKRAGAMRRVLVRMGLRVFVLFYLAMLVAVPVGSIAYKAFAPGFSTAWRDLTNPEGLGSQDFVHALLLTLLVAAIAVPLNTVFGVGV